MQDCSVKPVWVAFSLVWKQQFNFPNLFNYPLECWHHTSRGAYRLSFLALLSCAVKEMHAKWLGGCLHSNHSDKGWGCLSTKSEFLKLRSSWKVVFDGGISWVGSFGNLGNQKHPEGQCCFNPSVRRIYHLLPESNFLRSGIHPIHFSSIAFSWKKVLYLQLCFPLCVGEKGVSHSLIITATEEDKEEFAHTWRPHLL